MHKVILSLGSNLGDRKKFLADAIALVETRIGKVQNSSALYETEPWGFETENKFVNMVLALETELEPHAVLNECLAIEQELGRQRGTTGGYSSRTIDIDVLFYDDLVLSTDDLVLPHPHLEKRRFVLAPLCDVAPDLEHPTLQLTAKDLLKACKDTSQVNHLGYLN